MGLKSLGIAKATVKTPNGEFDVRGLSLTDIMFLAREHLPVMEHAYDQLAGALPEEGLEEGSEEAVAADLGKMLLEQAPTAAAEVIALASDDFDEESVKIAMALPFSAQVDALQKIGKLTFASEDDVKKAVAAVTNMLRGATSALNSLRVSEHG